MDSQKCHTYPHDVIIAFINAQVETVFVLATIAFTPWALDMSREMPPTTYAPWVEQTLYRWSKKNKIITKRTPGQVASQEKVYTRHGTWCRRPSSGQHQTSMPHDGDYDLNERHLVQSIRPSVDAVEFGFVSLPWYIWPFGVSNTLWKFPPPLFEHPRYSCLCDIASARTQQHENERRFTFSVKRSTFLIRLHDTHRVRKQHVEARTSL